MQFISTILQTFIMQIISTIPSCNYQVPVITTKKNFTFCPGKSRENFPNFFQDFSGLKNKIQGLSRTEKNPGFFQDVATLICNDYSLTKLDVHSNYTEKKRTTPKYKSKTKN